MPRKPTPLQLAGALGHAGSDKRVEILRRVAEAGSISQAARDAGVSYKAAWQALDTLNNLAGAALVERAVGGAGGGGARLTPAGLQVLRAADEVGQARQRVLARLSARERVAQDTLAGLALRTSMRNQLPAQVESLKPQAGAVRVLLRLPGGQPLRARITRESVQLLDLVPGLAVLALCKATAVGLAFDGAPQDEAANRLPGRITRISRAAGGGEFALALDGGQSVVGFAPGGHGLKLGAAATAMTAESAIVIALAG